MIATLKTITAIPLGLFTIAVMVAAMMAFLAAGVLLTIVSVGYAVFEEIGDRYAANKERQED